MTPQVDYILTSLSAGILNQKDRMFTESQIGAILFTLEVLRSGKEFSEEDAVRWVDLIDNAGLDTTRKALTRIIEEMTNSLDG